jgi:hypothetical protein
MGVLHSFRIKPTIIFIFNNLNVKLELHIYLYITYDLIIQYNDNTT